MQPASSSPPSAATPTPAAGAGEHGTVPGGSTRVTGEGERELVRKLTTDFERDEKLERARQAHFERWRDYQRGITPPVLQPDGVPQQSGQFPVQVNLCQSTSQVLTSRLYARNPEVSIRPSEAIHASHYTAVRDFGRTCELMLNHDFRRANLKRRMRKAVRATLTVGFSWLKAAMQLDAMKDPIMQTRINDLQDNLAEIRRKMDELDDGSQAYCDAALMQEELELEVAAAQAKLEVEVARGLVLANRRPEDVIVSGEVRELEDYLEANDITDRTWWRACDVAATFNVPEEDLARAARFVVKGDAATPTSVQQSAQGDWVAVLERWDRKAGVVHTWVHGCDWLLRPSAPPSPSASRFYPFFLVAWNWLDDTRYPQSDTAQWAPLQDEYNSTRSMQRVHRARSIPATVVNGAVVGPTDAAKINRRDVNEMVVLEGVDPQLPLANLVMELGANARMDPAVYDVKPILYDLDVVSGVQEAARQAIQSPKTATEAEIQDSSAQGRTGSRTDEIEDVLTDLARYALELQLQSYSQDDARRIAGEGAIWPSLSIEQLHQLTTIEIRAGSTGKPDTVRRQQTWGTLLPVIQPIIERIHALRQEAYGGMPAPMPGGAPAPGAAPLPGAMPGMPGMPMPGNPWAGFLADALEELLKETLERADERIDVDRFLPKTPQATAAAPPSPFGAPAAPAPLPSTDPDGDADTLPAPAPAAPAVALPA